MHLISLFVSLRFKSALSDFIILEPGTASKSETTDLRYAFITFHAQIHNYVDFFILSCAIYLSLFFCVFGRSFFPRLFSVFETTFQDLNSSLGESDLQCHDNNLVHFE